MVEEYQHRVLCDLPKRHPAFSQLAQFPFTPTPFFKGVIAFLADRPFISELGSGANRQLTERQNCTSHFSAAQPMSRAPKYLASSTRQSRGRDSLRDIVNYFQRFFENKRQTVVARKLLSNCGVLLRLH
jgi:hypothetical protein